MRQREMKVGEFYAAYMHQKYAGPYRFKYLEPTPGYKDRVRMEAACSFLYIAFDDTKYEDDEHYVFDIKSRYVLMTWDEWKKRRKFAEDALKQRP